MSRKKSHSRGKRKHRKSERLTSFESLERRVVLTASLGLEAPVDFSPAEVSTPTKRIVNGTQTSDYQAVGLVNGGCTGTLISPTHVLTAAHCVEGANGGFISDTDGTFDVNGQTYNTTKVSVHPNYDINAFDAGSDLAIMQLDRPVQGIAPMEILRDAPAVGQMLTLVGFGEGGTSTDGFDPNDDGKQVGQTELEAVTDQHITWNFDSHDEANTAPGDSGGPAFVNVGGTLLIAGVTSGGSGNAQTLGDESFDTRVDIHASWIDSVLEGTSPPNPGGGGGGGGGNPGPVDPPIDPVDEFDVVAAAQEELDIYDFDGNGELSPDEFVVELEDYGYSPAEADEFTDEIFSVYDVDGSGGLSLSELIASYEIDDEVDPDPIDPPTEQPVVGDINGDGIFDSADLIGMFASGHFEDGIANNSTLADGDMNGDGDVDTLDLIYAFQFGSFGEAPVDGDSVVDDDVDENEEDFVDDDLGEEDEGEWLDDEWEGDDEDWLVDDIDDAWADDDAGWWEEPFLVG